MKLPLAIDELKLEERQALLQEGHSNVYTKKDFSIAPRSLRWISYETLGSVGSATVSSTRLYHYLSVILVVTTWLRRDPHCLLCPDRRCLQVTHKKPFPLVKCKCLAATSVSKRHYHSLTLIIEREQVNTYSHFKADQICSQAWTTVTCWWENCEPVCVAIGLRTASKSLR